MKPNSNFERCPRLVRAMQYAAILSESEANAAIRIWRESSCEWSSEAVNCFGGFKAVVKSAWLYRHIARKSK